VGKLVAYSDTLGVVRVTAIMYIGCVKFKFNDIISLYTKEELNRIWFANLIIFYYIIYIKVIYFTTSYRLLT